MKVQVLNFANEWVRFAFTVVANSLSQPFLIFIFWSKGAHGLKTAPDRPRPEQTETELGKNLRPRPDQTEWGRSGANRLNAGL